MTESTSQSLVHQVVLGGASHRSGPRLTSVRGLVSGRRRAARLRRTTHAKDVAFGQVAVL